jgi:hypothetical protein
LALIWRACPAAEVHVPCPRGCAVLPGNRILHPSLSYRVKNTRSEAVNPNPIFFATTLPFSRFAPGRGVYSYYGRGCPALRPLLRDPWAMTRSAGGPPSYRRVLAFRPAHVGPVRFDSYTSTSPAQRRCYTPPSPAHRCPLIRVATTPHALRAQKLGAFRVYGPSSWLRCAR